MDFILTKSAFSINLLLIFSFQVDFGYLLKLFFNQFTFEIKDLLNGNKCSS